MPTFSVFLDPAAAGFYRRVADAAGLPLEQVLSDALFKLAGELALESLARRNADET